VRARAADGPRHIHCREGNEHIVRRFDPVKPGIDGACTDRAPHEFARIAGAQPRGRPTSGYRVISQACSVGGPASSPASESRASALSPVAWASGAHHLEKLQAFGEFEVAPIHSGSPAIRKPSAIRAA